MVKKLPKYVKYVKNKKPPQLWFIEWDDHTVSLNHSWHDPEEARSLDHISIISVGWVIAEDKKGIVVVNTICDDDHTGQPRFILKSCITKSVCLKDPCNWKERK